LSDCDDFFLAVAITGSMKLIFWGNFSYQGKGKFLIEPNLGTLRGDNYRMGRARKTRKTLKRRGLLAEQHSSFSDFSRQLVNLFISEYIISSKCWNLQCTREGCWRKNVDILT
jgi:hypothetical protein